MGFQTKVKALQDDVYRWKSLADILQVKDSRTNDDVRKRAAEAAELSAICKEMLRENASLEADLRQLGRAQQRVSVQRNKLQRKVVSLTKQKAGLQMRLSKHSTSQDISHSQVLDQSMSFQNDSENWDPNDIDIMPASQVPPPPLDESSYEDVSWFSCMWREETVLCSRMFDSKEVSVSLYAGSVLLMTSFRIWYGTYQNMFIVSVGRVNFVFRCTFAVTYIATYAFASNTLYFYHL